MLSATPQRGGKMTKSAMATPGFTDGAVRTVKIDGSCNYSKKNEFYSSILTQWSKETVLMTM